MSARTAASQVNLIRVATLALLFLVWEALAQSGLLYEGVVPSILQVASAFVDIVADPEFYDDLATTAAEVLIGFSIATVVGVGLGIVFGTRPFLKNAVEPYVNALATTPKIIFLPIVMLMFGIGPGSKVAIGALGAFFPIVLSTTAGMLQISPVLIRVARSFNTGAVQMVTKLYMPAVSGPIVTGMRLGIGVGTIAVLLGEIKLSKAGLGFLAITYYGQYRIAHLYALLLIIFALAALLNSAMTQLEKSFQPQVR
jgi:ABC-type nitrate/sulfonate/bicarbonate transport system permease component